MAKSVYDAALLLSIISGIDPLDNKSTSPQQPLTKAFEIPPNTPADYTEFTKHPSFKGMRLGVPRKVFFDLTFLTQEIIDQVDSAIHRIESLGAIIQDPADLPSAEEILTVKGEDLVTC